MNEELRDWGQDERVKQAIALQKQICPELYDTEESKAAYKGLLEAERAWFDKFQDWELERLMLVQWYVPYRFVREELTAEQIRDAQEFAKLGESGWYFFYGDSMGSFWMHNDTELEEGEWPKPAPTKRDVMLDTLAWLFASGSAEEWLDETAREPASVEKWGMRNGEGVHFWEKCPGCGFEHAPGEVHGDPLVKE